MINKSCVYQVRLYWLALLCIALIQPNRAVSLAQWWSTAQKAVCLVFESHLSSSFFIFYGKEMFKLVVLPSFNVPYIAYNIMYV